MNRVQALVAALAMTTNASAAPAVAFKVATTPSPPRCDVKINQPAAAVRLNRTAPPARICVFGCDAKLVGVRHENGQIAALAIYTGLRCRPAGSSKVNPKAAQKAPATAGAVRPPAGRASVATQSRLAQP